MPTTATIFFNTVLINMYPEGFLQLNPVFVNLSNIEIQNNEGEEPKRLLKRQVEHSSMFMEKKYAKQRQVILVEIRSSVMTQGANGMQRSISKQHFNLVIVDGKTAYLFEPQHITVHMEDISKLVASQFPDHQIVRLEHHPQSTDPRDVYCMVYVCALALGVLRDTENKSVNEIAESLFGKSTNMMGFAQMFLAHLQKDIPNLPPCPVGSWLDDHKGALIGAGAGGLIGGVAFGPWGLLGGAALGLVGGEILYDSGHRAGRY